MQTEFTFRLPLGYLDASGQVHRDGTMRLATAIDEIAPLRDLRVRNNEAYLAIVLLARVVTRLGTVPEITTDVIEHLFSADLAYLQDLYRQINLIDEAGTSIFEVECPNCGHRFRAELTAEASST